MGSTQTLKKRLIEITKNDYIIPEGIDTNALADKYSYSCQNNTIM